ncbi:MAG: hypothetical protein JXB88_11885, partial [Spirochaetales bacterium]|nr:hypothetical protein [Spirochaetales bacterium]
LLHSVFSVYSVVLFFMSSSFACFRIPPQKQNGLFLGDNQKILQIWRNGGSPLDPDIFMWLLSDSGGPE